MNDGLVTRHFDCQKCWEQSALTSLQRSESPPVLVLKCGM